jgi:hypothetical protein
MDFQLRHYSQRPWIPSILSECHDPQKAFQHWMECDALFGEEIIRQANRSGDSVIRVDGSVDLQKQFESIRRQFELG